MTVVLVAILTCLLLFRTRFKPRRAYPGPPAHFLLGNLNDIPKGGTEWVKHRDLARQYGDPVFFRVLAINSAAVAADLLESRAVLYSDRPRLPSVKELAGFGWNLILKSYHEGRAAHRRVVSRHLHPSVVRDCYRPVMQTEVRAFVRRIQASPGGLFKMIKLHRRARRVHRHDGDGEKTIGAVLMDIVPFRFKRAALARRQNVRDPRAVPCDNIKRDLAAGTAAPSIVSALIEERFATDGGGDGDPGLNERDIQDLGGTFYTTGADTTATALLDLILAMMLHPAVQCKAQAELDAVVGRHRLPDFADRDSGKLYYVACVLKEVLRWRLVAIAAPHYANADNEYNGWKIPEATVIGNICAQFMLRLVLPLTTAILTAILHDENTYHDPESFIPEWFRGEKKEPDPSFGFGFGRRVCPGRQWHFVGDSLFLLATSLLNSFTRLAAAGRQRRRVRAQGDVVVWTGQVCVV